MGRRSTRFFSGCSGITKMADLAMPPRVLTIGGSDSGGAAGIQADLKTFTVLGVYGMSALTVVTAQNSVRVAGLHALSPSFVAEQVGVVLADYGAEAVKTGFIGRVELIEAVAAVLQAERGPVPAPLVVDPVLVNHRGEPMFGEAVTDAYRQRLLPLAELITPNRREAALLTGQRVDSVADMGAAARALVERGARSALITGGRDGDAIVDVFFDGLDIAELRASRLETANTHGSGDTLSAAIAAFLARGMLLLGAVARAQGYTRAAIAASAGWRLGAGHGPLAHWVSTENL